MRTVVLATWMILCSCPGTLWSAEPLRLVEAIPLPGVEGRIDHLALDGEGQQLFVAALGNNTMEVIDLSARKVVKSIRGLKEPQGVAFLKEMGVIAVANGDDGAVRFFDSNTYDPVGEIEFRADADNLRYDAAKGRLYVGYGNGAIGIVDAANRKHVGDITLAAHPESFQLEKNGGRIFANIPEAGQIAVLDRDKQSQVAKWPVHDAAANFPMALDESHHRVFVGCRKPAKLLVLKMENGEVVAHVDITGDTDDLFYDAAAKCIYISGGEGSVTVVCQVDADNYKTSGKVVTAPGARTSFFDAKSRNLYVAVPKRGEQPAEIRVLAAQ